jgi:hypothetical protein
MSSTPIGRSKLQELKGVLGPLSVTGDTAEYGQQQTLGDEIGSDAFDMCARALYSHNSAFAIHHGKSSRRPACHLQEFFMSDIWRSGQNIEQVLLRTLR